MLTSAAAGLARDLASAFRAGLLGAVAEVEQIAGRQLARTALRLWVRRRTVFCKAVRL